MESRVVVVDDDTDDFCRIDIDRVCTNTLIHLSQWNRLTCWTVSWDVNIV
jgi:hypothetical protein